MRFEFDKEMFTRQVGKPCQCYVLSDNMSKDSKHMCPCDEFRNNDKCRCGLFKEMK